MWRAWYSFILFPFAALASWIVSWLVACPLSPFIAAYSVIVGVNNVGGIVSYLYTHNASLDGGVEQKVEGYQSDATGFRLWWQRTCWICRNPAYKFNAYILGFSATGATIIYRVGLETDPKYSLWTVVQSPSGWKFFGYRGSRCWLGWNYIPYGGRHQLKSKPYKF